MADIRTGSLDNELGCTHILEEDLENTTGLLVDETRDTLHTATASETTDSLHKDNSAMRLV